MDVYSLLWLQQDRRSTKTKINLIQSLYSGNPEVFNRVFDQTEDIATSIR